MSWWSWQSTDPDGWAALTAPIAPFPPPDPGWPALAAGSKGDEVVWLQQHLESFDPAVLPTATFDAATDLAVRNLQAAHGLPVTGATDPLSWQAVLALPLQPVAWTAADRPAGGAKGPAETSAARAPGSDRAARRAQVYGA